MKRCSEPQCPIAKTGKCLDGHEKDCPNLLADESLNVPADKTGDGARPRSNAKLFHSGEKLSPFEATRLLCERPAAVVLCAGGRDCGKTTFLAKIGEMYRFGTFSSYRFAGSLTLCAFERATWHATISSGTNKPRTPRSSRAENDFYLHLRVHPQSDPSAKKDIIISDLAGETFPDAIASQSYCSNLSSLCRADHMVGFLDCARLVDGAQRHSEVSNMVNFLTRVAAVRKSIPRPLHLQLVFSKWDYAIRNSQRVDIERRANNVETEIAERFKKEFSTIKVYRIAARPDADIPATDSIIQSLFGYWLEQPVERPLLAFRRNPDPERDFCAFGPT